MPAYRLTACVLLLVLAGAWSGPAAGHAMLHEIVEGEAIVVRFEFAGADRPAFEPYEVFAPAAETPFQAGRVNALGEVSFRPDRPGTWRVKVFTADGHGTVIEVDVDEAGALAAAHEEDGHGHPHWSRVVTGIGYLLGVFGLLALWRQQRTRVGPA